MKTHSSKWILSAAALASIASGLSAQQAAADDPVVTSGPRLQSPKPVDDSVDPPGAISSRTTVALPTHITPIHTAPDDEGQSYGIWAAGSDYKASFHSGMTFVPYLGGDYPHNQPFSWSTQSVKVGGQELVTQAADGSHTSLRYEYDLGDVIEAYDVQSQGLFQTFVIAKRPDTVGDLVVTGRLTTQLQSNPVAKHHGPIVFADADGQDIVSYGAAFAVDADGRKTPMSTTYADGILSLTLDASWVETAAFPLTVDPLVGTSNLRSGAGSRPFDVDAIWDDETDGLWFIYSRSVSSTDADLWIWRQDEVFGAADIGIFTDITTSWSTDGGKIAYSGGTDKVIAVFSRFFRNNTPRSRRMRWHGHDDSDLTLQTGVGFLSPGSGTNDWRPDVGGTEGFTTGNDVCLIWQREENGTGNNFTNGSDSDIYAAILDLGASQHGSLGTPFELTGLPSSRDSERPSISRNEGSTTAAGADWLCVYQVYLNGASVDDWDICCENISSAGTTPGGAVCPEATPNDKHKLGPTIAGRDGRYIIVYSTALLVDVNFKTSLTTGYRMASARVDSNGTSTPTVIETNDLFGNTDRRWVPGGAAYDWETDSHFIISYYSNSTDNYYISTCGYKGRILRQYTQYSGSASDNPSVGGLTFNDDSDEYLSVFPVNGTSDWVVGDRLLYESFVLESSSGTSCGSVTLNWIAPGRSSIQDQLIGHEFSSLTASGASPTSVHFLVISTSTSNLPVINPGVVAAGCRALVTSSGSGFIGIEPFKIGSTVSWDLPVPEFVFTDTIYFQDWYTNGAGLFESSVRREVNVVK